MGKRYNYMSIRFPDFKNKALTLSYDDGVATDKRFIEMLDGYGVKCTFNLDSMRFHDVPQPKITSCFSVDEAKKVYTNCKHEIALHSLTHPNLNVLPQNVIAHQVSGDMANLESMFGRIVRGMAYPDGRYNDKVVEVLRNCGVSYARTVDNTHDFLLPDDWLRLKPTCYHLDPELMTLADRFINENPHRWESYPWLFYVWGHTYEFEKADFWGGIEEFLKRVSGKEEVWYATNIEIYTYLRDYERLEISCDQSMVYNPTVSTIYFVCDGESFKVAPGETIHLY